MDEGYSGWSLTLAWDIKQLKMDRGTDTHGLPEFVKVKDLGVSCIRCRFCDTEIWGWAVGEGEASIRAPQQTNLEVDHLRFSGLWKEVSGQPSWRRAYDSK